MLDRVCWEFGDPAVYAEVDAALERGEIRLVDDIERKLATVRRPLERRRRVGARARASGPALRELDRDARSSRRRVAIVTSSFRELVEPVLGEHWRAGRDRRQPARSATHGWRAYFRDLEVCEMCGEPCKRGAVARSGPTSWSTSATGSPTAAWPMPPIWSSRATGSRPTSTSTASTTSASTTCTTCCDTLGAERAGRVTSAPPRRTRAWWARDHGGEDGFLTAYFSMEFGIGEELPVYSGGLGILAGDHLKAAADLGVPLVGVGLLYRLGYFRQVIDGDGQDERYVELDPAGGRARRARATRPSRSTWRASRCTPPSGGPTPPASRCTCSTPTSTPTRRVLRSITDALYGGDREHRLRQELVLGIGGPRALAALGLEPSVFHVNEGHAAFLSLERLRTAVAAGRPRDDALDEIRASTVFTTHTPVPAGNERFDPELVRRYVEPTRRRGRALVAGVQRARQRARRRLASASRRSRCGPPLARTASRSSTARSRGRCGASCAGAAPIGAVTNGVHFGSWITPAHARPARGDRRRARRAAGRAGLGARARPRPRRARRDDRRAQGEPAPAAWTARTSRRTRSRSASRGGSRPTSAPPCCSPTAERLRRLLHDAARPVQFVVAGKAHPADERRQGADQADLSSSRERRRPRHVVLPDYDMALAQVIVARRRRLAEHAAPAAGGVRDERHEGGAERRRSTSRRSTAGGPRRTRRRSAGRSTRASSRTRPSRTRPTPRSSTGCWSRRSCPRTPTGRAGSTASPRRSRPSARGSAPTAWCASTPRATTCPAHRRR